MILNKETPNFKNSIPGLISSCFLLSHLKATPDRGAFCHGEKLCEITDPPNTVLVFVILIVEVKGEPTRSETEQGIAKLLQCSSVLHP